MTTFPLANATGRVHSVLFRGRTISFRLAFLGLAVAIAFESAAQALIVGNVPDVVPNTAVGPASYYGTAAADPGWNNVSASGGNYVYLGDGWVLSARHVGYSASAGVSLQTYLPDGSPGPVKSFYRIPGSYYHDYGYGSTNVATRQYAVSNPMTIQNEAGATISLAASNGTYFTDLQLFRISEDPGLPSLAIASQPMASDFTQTNAPEVMVVGNGRRRQVEETHWNRSGTSPNYTWTETEGAGTHQGYKRDNVVVKSFGTNRLADLRPNRPGDPSDPSAVDYTQTPNQIFNAGEVISDTTGSFSLFTNDGVTRDIISMMTVFNDDGSAGATTLETQATTGNSGSAVFHNRGTAENPTWELAGIVHATWTHEDQPTNTAVYGNSILISDLSYYWGDYENSIRDIIESHHNYSHLGDINLNGLVAGTGEGAIEADDVTAFVAGWGYDNGQGVGTITSWQKGDLNRDGRTNVADFLLLRGSLNGQISASVIETLFGQGGLPGSNPGVPEPSTAVLALLASAAFAGSTRRRRA